MNSQDLSDALSKPPGCTSQFLVHSTYVEAQRLFIGFKFDLLSLSDDHNTGKTNGTTVILTLLNLQILNRKPS